MNAKRMFIVSILSLTALFAHAQFYVGGSLGLTFDTQKEDGETYHEDYYYITPEVGYKFSDFWSAGVYMSFVYGSEYHGDDEYTSFELWPYARATFAHLGRVHFYSDLFAGHVWVKEGTERRNIVSCALAPGFLVDLTDKLQIRGGIVLLEYDIWKGGNQKTGYAGIGRDWELGVLFYF